MSKVYNIYTIDINTNLKDLVWKLKCTYALYFELSSIIRLNITNFSKTKEQNECKTYIFYPKLELPINIINLYL